MAFRQHHHLQAIVTKYHGPTNTRGAKVSATASAGRVVISYDHALPTGGNHRAAADALMAKMGWGANGEVLISGGMPDGKGDVFVIVTAADQLRLGPNAKS